MKKSAKIASGNNSLLNSPDGLEETLNENKLPGDNEGSYSSRNSVADIPENIQQRLNRLKSKNNLNESNDASGSEHGDDRRDSVPSLASSTRGWRRN